MVSRNSLRVNLPIAGVEIEFHALVPRNNFRMNFTIADVGLKIPPEREYHSSWRWFPDKQRKQILYLEII